MSKKPETWKKNKSKTIADCRVFQVREDYCENSETEKEATFFVIENPDWVNIIALTKEEQIVLIQQYRHGTQEITLEIPGGMVDEGEEPLECAKRELLEETGFTAREFIYLGKSHPNPALQENLMFHFLALDCEETGKTDLDEHESIFTKLYPINEIPCLILEEKITHALVLAGFYKFEKYRQNDNKYIYES
jgi:8-oxo-dGTP pyrophosphatase MutT (NUDIX family)